MDNSKTSNCQYILRSVNIIMERKKYESRKVQFPNNMRSVCLVVAYSRQETRPSVSLSEKEQLAEKVIQKALSYSFIISVEKAQCIRQLPL